MSTTNILDLNNRIDALEKISHNVEPIQQQIDELKAWTYPGTKDASGNPITLTDGSARKEEGLSVTCNPKQNLHGYDHPWAGGAGKNKLPMTVDGIKALNVVGTWSGNTYTVRGVSYQILTDEAGNITGVKATGTASAGVATITLVVTPDLDSDTSYVLNGCPTNGGANTYNIQYSNMRTYAYEDLGNGVNIQKFDYSTYPNAQIAINIVSGYAIPSGGITFYPMIRLASVSDATFEPYTNICPITGYTECVVTVKDEDETTQDTATITFGHTVYGGSVDFKTGKVTVTHAYKVFDGTETWYVQPNANRVYTNNLVDSIAKPSASGTVADITSNIFGAISSSASYIGTRGVSVGTSGYVEFADGIGGMTVNAWKTYLENNTVAVCYELETPTELTLTPAELELLKGYNYISTNGTNIELTYMPDTLKADILLTVSQLYGSKIAIFDGILTGGDTGQVLTKTTDDNYDATWETLPATRTTTKKSEK